MIDLRSDTVTRPTKEMLNTMIHAPVGDDVFGEDPTINKLEAMAAEMFGMEAGLFCPSGTMTNQIAIKLHTQPGDEIICHEYSHIYNYEGGGLAANSGCQTRLLKGDRGFISAEEVAANIGNPHDVHAARTSMVSVENTVNKGGGSCYELSTLEAIGKVARANNLAYHIDGARIFNALVAKNQNAKDYGKLFDTISICLSKGLGCPVGSLLLGSKEHIMQARRIRKRFGGGMRQAGYLAAAGIYALKNHIDRLAEDHEKAQVLKSALEKCSWVDRIEPVETNIVIFYLKEGLEQDAFMGMLKENGILAVGMGQGKLRFVTHLDISSTQISQVANVLENI
ncbi:threonine aldolase [Owenweeksia hongkongensis DSM 17368]|uniref:Threonine aldolase n=1 Tax=Owenweeksia hongkongensis (strain DSM 17368 / CIP 108786 / JCM 12287 / NRRL B-23963 / UST20020801) TaxID=926562 RepID=G8QZZ1_OWEHD|nr:GntG family PLP-dependent aldolase [Owenweeksia hongkongensis]AEV32631.1 threonine aldolase [Owenweeksia hongkongensis DSM 17368]